MSLTPRAFKDAAYDHLAEVGRALSSATRLELLELIVQAPRTVESLSSEVGQSMSNTSHHLQALKRAQLVTTRRDGLNILYTAAGPDVALLLSQLQAVAGQRVAALASLTRDYFAERDDLEALSVPELIVRLRANKAILIDVRPEHEFAAGHLPGALSIPLPHLEARLDQLPRDRTIVAYCRGPFCAFSAEAARRLRALGYDARRTDATVSSQREAHWQQVYTQKSTEQVSWYRPHLDRSLALIAAAGLHPAARIVDVGAGASTLVDDLLDRGFTDIAVVDVASAALEAAQARLGARALGVRWIAGDITTPLLEDSSVDLWHDRAVLHFLTDPAERSAYLSQLQRCVRPGGHVLLATFAPDGPERCSDLPVVRYTSAELAALLGPDFETIAESREVHRTPRGSSQAFSYALCQRRPPSP